MKIKMNSGEIIKAMSVSQRGLRNAETGEVTRKIEIELQNKKSVLLDPSQFTIIPNSYEFERNLRRDE